MKENNYFHESPEKNNIYLHGFKCKNVRVKPVVFESNPNEIMFPDQARKNHLNYFATVHADVEQFVERRKLVNLLILIQLLLQIYQLWSSQSIVLQM